MDSFNSLAEELVRRLKSNAKLPSLYQQLELLGPLLEAKYGGRLSMNRLQFVQGENHCCLHARMPYEFYEGAYANWTELSRRESTELRNYLIELLTQWINTEQEVPPEPPRKATFSEVRNVVRAEFTDATVSPLHLFYVRRWRSFEAAFELVFDPKGEKAAQQIATLMQYPSLADDAKLWSKWPFEDKFFTLSSYRGTANSALGLAERFAGSVFNALEVGRLEALRKSTSECNDLAEDEVLAWWTSTRKQAFENTLAAHQWSLSETFRDRDILRALVERELKVAVPAEVHKRLLVKQPELNLWDRNLLLGMFEMGLFDGNYASSTVILKHVAYPSDGKRAFDNLKSYHLIKVPKNTKGRMLTEKGVALARKLTEHN